MPSMMLTSWLTTNSRQHCNKTTNEQNPLELKTNKTRIAHPLRMVNVARDVVDKMTGACVDGVNASASVFEMPAKALEECLGEFALASMNLVEHVDGTALIVELIVANLLGLVPYSPRCTCMDRRGRFTCWLGHWQMCKHSISSLAQ